MLRTRGNVAGVGRKEERCDVRVWSGACEHGNVGKSGEKYLCPICETVAVLNHEVKHDAISYVSGDYKNMS